MESVTAFKDCFPSMEEYGFIEKSDYTRVYPKCPTLGGTQEIVDYLMFWDMAKQICMIQRTTEGGKGGESFPNLRTRDIVAEALGYDRPTKAVGDHVDTEDRDAFPIRDSIGRMQKAILVLGEIRDKLKRQPEKGIIEELDKA